MSFCIVPMHFSLKEKFSMYRLNYKGCIHVSSVQFAKNNATADFICIQAGGNMVIKGSAGLLFDSAFTFERDYYNYHRKQGKK